MFTSLVLGSLAAWASFVCLIFSTIFLIKAWLLFSFLAMIISRTNHRALVEEEGRCQISKSQFQPYFCSFLLSIFLDIDLNYIGDLRSNGNSNVFKSTKYH